MQDYQVAEILENEIFIHGNSPAIVIDGGFSVEGISDIEIETNTQNLVSGSCTIETTHDTGGNIPLYGDFTIEISNGEHVVSFENFNLE